MKLLLLTLLVTTSCFAGGVHYPPPPPQPEFNRQSATSSVDPCEDALIRQWREANLAFYKHMITPEMFWKFVEARDLADHGDLKTPTMQRLLGNTPGSKVPEVVFEVGAGYGRVVDYLVRETDIPKIHAAEISPEMGQFLRASFDFPTPRPFKGGNVKGQKQVWIWESTNIADPNEALSKLHVNLCLWPFAGILELSKAEKVHAMENLYLVMKKGSTLVVDIPAGPIQSLMRIRTVGHLALEWSQEGKPYRYFMHPIQQETQMVDIPELRRIIERDAMFKFVETVLYHPRFPELTTPDELDSIQDKRNMRRYLIFRRR